MRILICWSRVSGYMSACWRRLARCDNVDLRVIAWGTSALTDSSAFGDSIVEGVNCRLLSTEERSNVDIINNEIDLFRPDVIVVPGWISSSYTKAIQSLGDGRPRVIMGMDTPWKGNIPQHLTKWRYASLLRTVDHVVVAGERTWQYARKLGFDERQITRGVYAWDEDAFAGRPPQQFRSDAAENSFVFVGRLAEEKGISTLIEAYRKYRDTAKQPWSLKICGSGPLSDFRDTTGVELLGFLQPKDLPEVLHKSSVFVLPSHYEPWGVAMAEAMGAGLPVIASEACGASVDLLRPYWNGLLVPTGCSEGLAGALKWFHDHSDRIKEMGANARTVAEPFSSANWVVRWQEILRVPAYPESATIPKGKAA